MCASPDESNQDRGGSCGFTTTNFLAAAYDYTDFGRRRWPLTKETAIP
jgi:hypothetical protein